MIIITNIKNKISQALLKSFIKADPSPALLKVSTFAVLNLLKGNLNNENRNNHYQT